MATILIVDDEADILFLLRMTLERAGYTVVEASDGATALERIREGPPDLIVTDLMMPVMDGRELIGRVQADPGGDQIPILLVSANPSSNVGAHAIMRKPFRQDDLLKTIRFLLDEAS